MTPLVRSGLDADTVLEQIDADREGGFGPTLAVVFASADHDLDALRAALTARGLDVVGATTAGEIADATILDRGIAVMLWDAAPGSYAVWAGARTPDEATEAVAARLGADAAARFERPVVVAFASGVSTDGEAVVRGALAGAGRPIQLHGGLAGDDFQMVETTVFTGEAALSDGVVALILDGDRYHVEGLATGGWQPVGVEKTVTRSTGNVVFELDGESALDVYADYFAMSDLRSSPQSIAMELGVQYPLSVQRDDGTVVIRAPLLSDPETNGLVFAGAVPQGARVRFCVPPSLDIVDRVVEEAGTLRDQLPNADAVLLVSCKARHLALGPIAEDEVEGLAGLWNAPLAGFFSYGEIGAQASGACDFHNETCSLIVVRERSGAHA